MPSFNLPGGWTTSPYTRASNYGVIPRTLTQGGITVPAGRAMLNGSTQIRLLAWRLMLAGYGSGNTNVVSCSIDGVGGNSHSIAGSTQAQDTGERAFSPANISPGTKSLVISFDDRIYFGRQNYAPSPVGGNGANSWGAMVGYCTYAEAPTAPGTPVAVVTGSDVSITWPAPSDNGGSSLTGYVFQIDDDPAFGSPTTLNPATAAQAISALPPGTYHVRVGAKNAVTTAAGSQSVWSVTTSFTIEAGWKVKRGGVFYGVPPKVKRGGVFYPAISRVKRGGVFVPTG